MLIASNSGDDWWPVPGFNKVVKTLNARYAAYGVPEKFEAGTPNIAGAVGLLVGVVAALALEYWKQGQPAPASK